jgi:predicted transcriptional regulator
METFHSKRLLQATVSEDVIRAIRRILELERAEAERSDRAKPSLSATVEMLLRKGIKAYHAETKRSQQSATETRELVGEL